MVSQGSHAIKLIDFEHNTIDPEEPGFKLIEEIDIILNYTSPSYLPTLTPKGIQHH